MIGRLALATILLVTFAISCGAGSDDERTGPTTADGVRVASFDFPESELLAEMYAQVMEASGIPVVRLGSVGPREIIAPAIEQDLIDFVPEYLGAALARLGAQQTDPDTESSREDLNRRLTRRGMIALAPSTAEDVDVFVVTRDRGFELDVQDLSDLARVAGELRFGGTAECPDRDLCLIGLREVYGIEFAEVLAQQSLRNRVDALRRGEIDVAQLFSTAPEIDTFDLQVLEDDLGLQPAQNVIPVIRTDALELWGPDVAESVDRLSLRLTTDDLRVLNQRVAEGEAIEAVARDWLALNLS